MHKKQTSPEKRIATRIQKAYGVKIVQVEFLHLGADLNTALYRLTTEGSALYFLKIRKGTFEEISVLVPRFLDDRGIQGIIPPLETKDNRSWVSLDAFTCVLYPLIEGCSGFEKALSDDQWVKFGAALKAIHTLVLPQELWEWIPSETYSSQWREKAQAFQELVEKHVFEDPLTAEMAEFMRTHSADIRFLIERSAQLGNQLRSLPLEQVLCHSDIHAGNLLLTKTGQQYIVDWDNPILAPKERDLMFIGGGVGGTWNSPKEEALFYQGYGGKDINLTALTYYRFERIVQDITAFCEQILLMVEGSNDRVRGFEYFTNQFLPDDVIDIALQTDKKLRES